MRKQSLLNPKTSESKLCSMPYGPSDQSYKLKKKPYLKAVLMASLVCQTLIPLACPSKVVAAYPAVFELSQLNQTTGFTINGISGISAISSAGDVNGDGWSDIVIGNYPAKLGGVYSTGQAYVVFGAPSFPAIFNLSSLNGSNGFVINPATLNSNGYLGLAVSSAGDMNGDGYDDIVVSAPEASPGGIEYAGQVYVILGASTFSPSFNVSSLNGANGFTMNGVGMLSGVQSVASAGDINGDGKDDIIMGAPIVFGHGARGQAYVVFGASFFPATLNLSSLNGTNGFTMNGSILGLQSVSSAGDINGDGKDDIIVGVADSVAGGAYVVFGAPFFPTTLTLANLNGTNGFIINYPAQVVASVGDINGDGKSDLIVSPDPISATCNAQGYVVFGASTFSPVFNVSNLNGSNGFIIVGTDLGTCSATEGTVVVPIGDINGDGLDDVVIGDGSASQAYIVYGAPSFSSSFYLSNLNGGNGFTINGINSGDGAGYIVSSAGDINGDGGNDIIIGASGANAGAGQAYVLYGTALPTTTTTAAPTTSATIAPATTSTSTTITPTTMSTSTSTVTTPATTTSMTTSTSTTVTPSTMYTTVTPATTSTSTKTVVPTTIPTISTTVALATSSTSTKSTTVSPTTISSASMTQSTIVVPTMMSTTVSPTITTAASMQPTSSMTSITAVPSATLTSTIQPSSSVSLSTDTQRVNSTTASGTNTTTMQPTTTSTTITTPTTMTNSMASLTTSTPVVTSTTAITTLAANISFSVNATQQSGAGTSSSSSSWTSTIVGVTVGVVAAIGAGYLAYRKWRGHGKGIAPQTKGAAIAAMNAMDSAREENDVSMQANPVYEGTTLQQAAGAYEQPHTDTWARDFYNTQEDEGKRATIAYDTLQQMPSTYEQPHMDTWARDLYNTQESQESATMYGAPPTIPVRDQAYDALQTLTLNGQGHRITNLNPQGSAWSAAYDTVHGGAKPLAYETILPDQQPWDESTYDLNLPVPGATGDYIDIVEPSDSRV